MIGLQSTLLLLAAAGGQTVEASAPPKNISHCSLDYRLIDRSLEIASKALASSDSKLDEMIASDAKFELWRGDTVSDFNERGVAAARAFFGSLKGSTFVIRRGLAPICAVGHDSAGVEFVSGDGKESIFTRFTFRDSKLQSVNAEVAIREEGRLGERR